MATSLQLSVASPNESQPISSLVEKEVKCESTEPELKRRKENDDDEAEIALEKCGFEELLGPKLETDLPNANWAFMSPVKLLPRIEVVGYPMKFPFNDDAAGPIMRKCAVVQAKNLRTAELAAGQFIIQTSVWQTAFESSLVSPLLESVRRELAPGCVKISAKLNKLRIYERSSFYKSSPHSLADLREFTRMATPSSSIIGSQAKHHFASLLVFLPSNYGGGKFSVSHHNKTRTYSFSLSNEIFKTQPLKCHAVAFFRSCQHEIDTVNFGYLATLVYDLHHDGGVAPLLPISSAGFEEEVRTAVSNLFQNENWPKKKSLGFLLSHDYQHVGRVGPGVLMKEDRIIYEALMACKLPLNVELATVHVRLTTRKSHKGQAGTTEIEIHQLKGSAVEFIRDADELQKMFGVGCRNAEKTGHLPSNVQKRSGCRMIARGSFDGLKWSWTKESVRFINNWQWQFKNMATACSNTNDVYERQFYSAAFVFLPKPLSSLPPTPKLEPVASSSSTPTAPSFSIIGDRKLFRGKGPRFSVVQGDPTQLEVDAIVNQTDSLFSIVGSVGTALKEIGGKDFEGSMRDVASRHHSLKPAEAIITVSCRSGLRHKFVIHVNTNALETTDDIKTAIGNILTQAEKLELHSIAISSIDFPDSASEVTKKLSGETLLATFQNHFINGIKNNTPSCIDRVYFLPSDMETIGIFLFELARTQ